MPEHPVFIDGHLMVVCGKMDHLNNKIKDLPAVVFAILLFFFQMPVWADDIPPTVTVKTQYGMLSGIVEEGALHFRAIPYALPPVGERRWQPPEPPLPWTGVKLATGFGPNCPQRQGGGVTSEDCLTLNIATPSHISRSGKLPVLVWIHGGGLVAGSGSSPIFSNRVWTAENIIFVSLNYRLGALGFFAHPALDQPQGVNYGLMDMIAALKWVNKNIEAFGGDRDRITIMGLSAGGMAVQLLMVSPEAKGLFSAAISQSGYGTWPKPRIKSVVKLTGSPRAEGIAAGIVARALNEPSQSPITREGLLAIPASRLVNAVQGFHLPIVDGITLPEETAILFHRGQQHAVPFVSGGNSYDGSVFALSLLSLDSVMARLGNRQQEVRDLYKEDFEVSDFQGTSRLFGDMRYIFSSYYMTRQMAKVGQPGYLYLYDYNAEKQPDWLGASHGSAAINLFNSHDKTTAKMRRYWINFIKTGHPYGEGLPLWPRQEDGQNRWMIFRDKAVIENDILQRKMDVLQDIYLKRVSN